jgi:phosphoglycolate phosphatase
VNRLINIFFDLDGTLTDPKEGITRCIQYALGELKVASPGQEELVAFIGVPLRKMFERILDSNEEDLIERAVALYRQRFSDVGMFENKVYTGISEVLATLHRTSCNLYVVTSKPRVYAERIIEHFGLHKYFNQVCGPELDGRYDNKVELIDFVLTENQLLPEKTVMIGDRKEDVIAGKSNKTFTMGVTYGYGGSKELLAAGVDHLCHSPYDIEKGLAYLNLNQ